MSAMDYPFAGVAGLDEAKLGLLLLAIDPGLKGALIAGRTGVAKSTLARSYRHLLESAGGSAAPFVEVPIGATEDRLLGGLWLDGAWLRGEQRVARGLLAQAHGGILHVDEINLLRDCAPHLIADALNFGVARLERDGFSVEMPAGFALIGTYDPAEGAVPRALADAVALHITEPAAPSLDERCEILTRALALDRDCEAFAAGYAGETARMADRIREGRDRLPHVRMERRHRRRLVEAAVELGVEGHRAEIFAARAARAHAALEQRNEVGEVDLEVAMRMVLAPRAKAPAAVGRECEVESPAVEGPKESRPAERSVPTPQPSWHGQALMDRERLDSADELRVRGDPSGPGGPPHLDAPAVRAGASNGRRKSNARQVGSAPRGRYVRAVTKRPAHGRIATEATLRAAARNHICGTPIQITASDLRFKQFRQKAGLLIVFALDSSGSMARNRIQQAKGAILRLLREAYLHRDTVALVGFRGRGAEVLLGPSRSVELARRALDEAPVGGATPLAAGLGAALDIVRRSQRQALLVLLTDGHANASARGQEVWDELRRTCKQARTMAIASLVIDTNQLRSAGAEAQQLARLLGARHVMLPRAEGDAMYDSVAASAASLR